VVCEGVKIVVVILENAAYAIRVTATIVGKLINAFFAMRSFAKHALKL
jgi:hypothetical protein